MEKTNQKGLSKEGRLKIYQQRGKQCKKKKKKNRTFPNHGRKSYQLVWGDDKKIYKLMQKKPNDFWLIYGNTKTLRKRRMNKKYDKRIRRALRRPKSRNTHRFTQNDTKNINLVNARPWWNTWFLVQETHLYSMDDQRKDYIDPKGPKQRNRPKQLTHIPAYRWCRKY